MQFLSPHLKQIQKQFDFIQIFILPHKCVFIWMFHSFIHIGEWLLGIGV